MSGGEGASSRAWRGPLQQASPGASSWLRVAGLYAKEAVVPLSDLVVFVLSAGAVVLAQFAFLSGIDPSGAAVRYLVVARLAFAFSGGQQIDRCLIESYMSGSLLVWALAPPDPLATLLARGLSGIARSVAIVAPVVLTSALLYRVSIDVSWPRAVLFLISLVLASIAATGLSLITAYIGTTLKQDEAAVQLKSFLAQLASGAVIPLHLFPAWARRLLAYLPFPHLADTPVVVALEGGSGRIAIQFAWGVVLFSVGLLLWRRRLRRLDVYGG